MFQEDAMFQVEVQRDIDAPIEDVFARLIDVPGYSSWLPEESFTRGCELTSDGPVDVGTTYVDHTKRAPMVGEVLELERPTRVVFRQRISKLGIVYEALQTNVLEAIQGGSRVHHRFDGKLAGLVGRLLKSDTHRIVRKERPIVLDALKASFEK